MTWFTDRNLKNHPFQANAIKEVFQAWETSDVVVLAGCPGSGKTSMSISIMDQYLQANPSHKVLVLTHGQVLLREQYAGEVTKLTPEREMNEITSSVIDASINIAIPQGLQKKEIGPIDLLIVDEAHQFYFAKMVQDIISRTTPSKQLLLTGTPSPFILRGGYPIIPITIMDIMDSGLIGDVNVHLVSASVNYSFSDFDTAQELKTSKISKDQVGADLDLILLKLLQRVNGCKTWSDITHNLHKTMIVTRSQKEAKEVKRYLETKGINPILSISEDGEGTDGFTRFREIEDEKIIIVVRRGILGFNLTSLRCVIDMSFGQNIDTIYQLFSRVVRKDPNGGDKLFIKLAPRNLEDYYRYIMTAVLCMAHRNYFLKYNGQNYLGELEIPVQVEKNPRNKTKKTKTGEMGKLGIRYSSDDLGDFINLGLIRKVMETGMDGETYALAKISDLKRNFSSRQSWTKEECREIALQYKTRTEWGRNHSKTYQSSRVNGWLDELTTHMDNKIYTKEKCREIALQYKTRREWFNGHNSYHTAHRNGWLDEITVHMKPKRKSNTKEECRDIALQCKSKSEWKKAHCASYQTSRINGWLDELTSHMTKKNK
jgi:superfamily II DNA or RNA helicase